jgi:hypothetical protein
MTLLAVMSQTPVRTATGVHGPVRRIRTVLLHSASGTLSVDEHIRVRFSAQEPWHAFADVLTGPGAGASKAAQLAASCPGALVVAVHHGPRCWLRLGPGDGDTLELGADGPVRPARVWESLASLAHSCLVAGLPAAALVSAAAGLLRTQPPDSSRSNRWNPLRVAAASSDCDRPTEE